MQDLQHMTVAELSALTASEAPVPGGGSISAMAGAFAASLTGMVAKLTHSKLKYAPVREEMLGIDKEAESLRLKLLDDIQRDSASYQSFMKALKMPKGSEDEIKARQNAMQAGLKEACVIPRSIAQDASTVLKLAVAVVKRGNISTYSDALVGAMLARTAMLGAVSNVRINLESIQDEAFRMEMNKACDLLEAQAHQLEQEAVIAAKTREE
ncbi:MAG: cyclodeaminase/cyclohydrolase family protein [Eubacteriales bacterium]|nr:cyclodeaminase/cyclohydrolase family protein [Eubacteriales bacterium]